MKSQYKIKINRHRRIAGLFFFAVFMFACVTSAKHHQNPVEEPTESKNAPATITPNVPATITPDVPGIDTPIEVFSIQDANKIPPEDVLQEVSFGGQGGGGR